MRAKIKIANVKCVCQRGSELPGVKGAVGLGSAHPPTVRAPEEQATLIPGPCAACECDINTPTETIKITMTSYSLLRRNGVEVLYFAPPKQKALILAGAVFCVFCTPGVGAALTGRIPARTGQIE